MNRSLYFIPLIEKALGDSNPVKALTDAFCQIEALSEDIEYSYGYSMFLAFISEVAEIWNLQSKLSVESATAIVEEITLEMFTEIHRKEHINRFPESAWVAVPAELRKHIEKKIIALSRMDINQSQVDLEIIRNGYTIATFQLISDKRSFSIGEIQPGEYTFAFASGRILLEVKLDKTDLILPLTHSGINLRLAADTGDDPRLFPTRKISLLGGEIVVRVYPGIESGSIEIRKDLKNEDRTRK